MLRLVGSILVLCMLGLSTGALQYVHELQHAAEDAREDALARQAGDGSQPHHHDESKCELCNQLHMAILLTGCTPIVIRLGLLIGLLALWQPESNVRSLHLRRDCRGPPAIQTAWLLPS